MWKRVLVLSLLLLGLISGQAYASTCRPFLARLAGAEVVVLGQVESEPTENELLIDVAIRLKGDLPDPALAQVWVPPDPNIKPEYLRAMGLLSPVPAPGEWAIFTLSPYEGRYYYGGCDGALVIHPWMAAIPAALVVAIAWPLLRPRYRRPRA